MPLSCAKYDVIHSGLHASMWKTNTVHFGEIAVKLEEHFYEVQWELM